MEHPPIVLYVVNSDWFFLSHRLPLALEAIKRGYTVHLISHDTGKRSEIESYGIEFTPLNFDPSGNNPIKNIWLIVQLMCLYYRIKPAVIHHVTIKPTLFGSIAARGILRNKPKVVNAISGLGYVFTGKGRSFIRFLVVRLMNIAYSGKQVFFIFQNTDDATFFKELGYLTQSNYVIIKGSGVDHLIYTYHPPTQKEPIRVVFSGRMLYDKGVTEFVEAAKILKPKWFGKAEFLLMGGMDAKNPSSLTKSILHQMEIPSYIEWRGHQADMMQECIDADIVCLPSYREGLPKSLVEAMAVGRPIVTTHTTGCKDCVDEGVNGFLVPVKSVVKLADAIDTLLSSKELREQMGLASRSKMENELTLEKVVEQTFRFYDGIVKTEKRTESLPKVSIITVTLEAKAFIQDAIESVLSQTYPHIEYIVIDGGSKDGSIDVINSYGSKIHKIISETDEGMYDALNKGLAMATGDIIGFLHSDDFYAEKDSILKVAEAFDNHTDAVYGDLDYVSLQDKNKVVRRWRSGAFSTDLFYKGWMPPHPTFFVRKAVYEKFGGYDLSLKSAADYELMLRMMVVHKIRVKYLPEVLVKMRLGGQSNRSWLNRFKANLEDRRAWTINNLKPHWYTLLLKPIKKIPQYFSFK